MAKPRQYVLRLFVAGTSPRSTRAVLAVKRLCQERPDCEFDLQVIDIYKAPQTAVDDQIVAVPMLIRKEPLPMRRFVGDMSDLLRLKAGLGLA